MSIEGNSSNPRAPAERYVYRMAIPLKARAPAERNVYSRIMRQIALNPSKLRRFST